jgi:nucleoside-diphosphate-sugar epimerase
MPSTGDVLLTHADVSKAMADLNYRPSTSLSAGLGKFVVWYKVTSLGSMLINLIFIFNQSDVIV